MEDAKSHQPARRKTEEQTKVIQFKACPRCHGDLIEGRDQYGSYLSCIQCGRYMAKSAETAGKRTSAGKSAAELNADLAELLAA